MPRDDYESFMEDPRLEETRPITSRDLAGDTVPSHSLRRRRRWGCGCSRWMLWPLVLLLVYLLAPFRTNVLLLGVDRAPDGTDIARSDTIILLGVQPLSGRVNMLSIPRDLWVPIPGYGESRINSAHSWGEGEAAGGGPRLAAATVKDNFGVNVKYYLRVRLEGFPDVIDALGGIDLNLSEPAAGYPAGSFHLNGTEALAFVRDRSGDDFFRQEHGQLFIVALAKKLLNPLTWWRIPGALISLARTVDTNIPVWSWPRLGLALGRAVLFDGVHAVVLPREAVTPWVTTAGAQVLLPNWDLILPVVRELFGLF